MAQIPVQQLTGDGVAVTLAAAAAGDTYKVGSGLSVRVKNGSGSDITVTQTAYGKCSQGFLHDEPTPVVAGATVEILTSDSKRFVNPATGLGLLVYSSTTTVTRASVQS